MNFYLSVYVHWKHFCLLELFKKLKVFLRHLLLLLRLHSLLYFHESFPDFCCSLFYNFNIYCYAIPLMKFFSWFNWFPIFTICYFHDFMSSWFPIFMISCFHDFLFSWFPVWMNILIWLTSNKIFYFSILLRVLLISRLGIWIPVWK